MNHRNPAVEAALRLVLRQQIDQSGVEFKPSRETKEAVARLTREWRAMLADSQGTSAERVGNGQNGKKKGGGAIGKAEK